MNGTFVRTCDTSVYGELGSGWRTASVIGGPLAFVRVRGYEYARVRDLGRGGPPFVLKVLAVVNGDMPVTLTIPARLRSRAALLYDPALFDRGPRALRDRIGAVTLEPCGGDQPSTQFNGGFVIAGPTCLPLHVSWGTGQERIALPLGGACPRA